MALTNSEYDTIMRRYEERQLQNQRIVQQRKDEAYQRSPRLKELEDSIASLAIEKARLLLEGDEHALAQLHEELIALTDEKDDLLSQLGYAKDYFTPPYQCPDCQDTGYVGNEKCHCFQQAILDLTYRQSNLYEAMQEENFDTFSYEYYPQDVMDGEMSSYDRARHAVETCKRFIETFDNQFQNLLLYGDTGVGKSFLSHCVARELLRAEHSVVYFSTFELFQVLEQAAFHREERPSESYQTLFGCDLLIIDDLGTELANSFTTSQLFVCLNERILRRKPTIISTNLTLSQLAEQYSERIFSRLTSHYTMVKMFGPDIRVQKKIAYCELAP